MLVKEKEKYEIEAKASGMSDFLKMDYLEACLKENFSFDIKKFCNVELAKLYEQRNMFSEAARKMEAIGEISITFREKKQAYMKAVELYVKAGLYNKAEFDLKKAKENANSQEKKEMKKAILKLVKEQAEVYEKENRRGKALPAYEWLYKMIKADEDSNQDIKEEEIKAKLLELYSKLGKISEYNILKGN